MRDRFGAQEPALWKLRFHTQTAGVSLTAQQPYNNVVRTALQALAAVLGGTNRCTPIRSTRRWRCPPSRPRRIALRTQQIIAHETGVANGVDPLGGSYFVEKLTRDMEDGALDYLDTIDAWAAWSRPSSAAIRRRKSPRRRTSSSRRSSARRRSIVGVNDFVQSRRASRSRCCTSTTPRRACS